MARWCQNATSLSQLWNSSYTCKRGPPIVNPWRVVTPSPRRRATDAVTDESIRRLDRVGQPRSRHRVTGFLFGLVLVTGQMAWQLGGPVSPVAAASFVAGPFTINAGAEFTSIVEVMLTTT